MNLQFYHGPYEAGTVFAIKDNQTGEQIHEYKLDQTGKIVGERSGAYKYDPRIRPWYKAAIIAEKPTSSQIYAWLSRDGTESTLGIGFVKPVRDHLGNIQGVIDAELSLHDISQFLDTLQVGKTGLAFVTNRKGQVIATSTGAPVTDLEQKLIPASKSSNKVVAAAGMYLKEEFKSLEKITIR